MNFQTRKISNTDLELVRYWRNKDFVRNQMLTESLISSKNQKKWFLNLDHKLNHVFIYSIDDIDIGVVTCKITSIEEGIFDIGVYCGNSNYSGHPVNFISIIFIHDYAFETLNLKKSITSIKKNNISSIKINKKIGYTVQEEYNEDFDLYNLDKSHYNISKKKIDKIITHFLNKAGD